jgi:outer membrane protein assembly factor BamB/plastocyanin
MRNRPGSLMRGPGSSPRRAWSRAVALLAVSILAAALAAGCGGDSEGDSEGDAAAPAAAEWMQPNGSFENTRVANSEISSENVDQLRVAWTQPLTGAGPFGAFASMPLISDDGIAYVQDLASNVMAYDLETGEQLWKVEFDAPTIGPNGLAYEDGLLFGTTNGEVFALDAESGEEAWKKRILEYDFGVAEGQNLGFTIQPAVRDGVLYLAEAAKAGGGRAFGFDAKTGEELWAFDTTEEPKGDRTPSAGAWNTPLVDDEGNVYYSVANGYYSHNSPKSTQNERLYTNSLVKLDGETGELLWHYQAIPNDFWDWDLHLSPVLADDGDRQLVVTGGKLGYVIAVDPETGEEVWKTPVGVHNGHDEDSRKQLDGTLKLPPTPFEVFPGPYGGVETNVAVHDGKVYAAVVNLPGLAKKPADLNRPVLEVDFARGKGELVRLDLATGKIDWSVDLDTMPFGAATISNDLLFTTLFDGRVVAHSLEDGSEVWSTKLPAATNSPLTIAGDTLVTAAAFPQAAGQKPELVVFKLNAERITPPAPSGDEETTETGAADDGAGVIEVGVVEGELRFDPSELTAQAGEVTFRFTNPDSLGHDFVIEKDGERIGGTELISNDSAEVTVTLEPGEYTYICTPHESAGMTGTLTVTG